MLEVLTARLVARFRKGAGGYVLSVAAIALAMLLRLAFGRYLPNGALAYITFSPAVMVVATVAGFWPGALATLLTLLVAAYWVIPPSDQFLPLTGTDVAGLCLFSALGILMSGVAHLYHRALAKAAEADKELAAQHEVAKVLRENEKALSQAKEEWEGTFNSIPDLIAILDAKHQVVRVNQAMADRFGATPEECVGLHCYEIVHGCHEPPLFCPHSQTMKDHQEHAAEVREASLGGDFLVSTTPLRDREGKVIGTVHVARNITERKRAEELVRKAASDLERSNKDLEHFAYAASHDLQEPLRSISSFVQLLQKRYGDKLDETASQYIQYAVDGCTRMQGLIQDMLGYSRLRSSEAPLVCAEMELALQEAKQSLARAIEETRAVVTHDPLPRVKGDPTQLRQLLQNLIGNALKYRKERENPRVHISAEREGDLWRFSVTDNGIGFDPKYKDRIFRIFQRLHTAESYNGSGVGLAICKRIVERHGGEIDADSKEDQGSTFFFTLMALDGDDRGLPHSS